MDNVVWRLENMPAGWVGRPCSGSDEDRKNEVAFVIILIALFVIIGAFKYFGVF